MPNLKVQRGVLHYSCVYHNNVYHRCQAKLSVGRIAETRTSLSHYQVVVFTLHLSKFELWRTGGVPQQKLTVEIRDQQGPPQQEGSF